MTGREFVIAPAKREQVTLWTGIMGPSGGGKTFSALRMATGMVSVTGGKIYVADTEARRALHYADAFGFEHLDFGAPFGSLDYLDAVRRCAAGGAGCIIVDSMSHEHEGEGGYLWTQEQELVRMSGEDDAKRERVKMASWIKPAGLRQKMINGLLQTKVNIIFCYRAKEKTKPLRGQDGKMRPVELGFMPIAAEALLYEMTAACLLLPRANGVPTWQTDNIGERQMMKLPRHFEKMFGDRQIDEKLGADLATWAKGDTPSKGKHPAAAAAPNGKQASEPDDWDEKPSAETKLAEAAAVGTAKLKEVWRSLTNAEREPLKEKLDKTWKAIAKKMDETAQQSPT